jgi:hypothetical protein
MFVFVERNQIKYFLSQNQTLLKVSCVSHTSEVYEPHCGHPIYSLVTEKASYNKLPKKSVRNILNL